MDITAKLWSYCHILRHDGVDNVDYIEQLTYLLFLKMTDENGMRVPKDCNWKSLIHKTGKELKEHYEFILDKLKSEKGILGEIFQEPISKIKNPVSLKKIIDGIESVGWTNLDKDVQGEAFEGLLEKTATEGKKGAGQFFTPRPLIRAIVNVMKPNPLECKNFSIADPACGTAGFLTMAIEWAKENVPLDRWLNVRNSCYHGQELVVRPYRLALMNLYLHDVKAKLLLGDSIYSHNLTNPEFNCILTNPPFGTRGTVGPPNERNFLIETSNIQLNFVQHVFEKLKSGGRAAIILPDSCLTDSKARELWEVLIGGKLCNVHTILRLPRGTFTPYANGVKACVIFFEKGAATKDIWVYDARTNVDDVTKSSRPLEYEKHFKDFVISYGTKSNGKSKRIESAKFKCFPLALMKEKKYDLSFTELQVSQQLEQPIFYVNHLIENFESQLINLRQLKNLLEQKKDAQNKI